MSKIKLLAEFSKRILERLKSKVKDGQPYCTTHLEGAIFRLKIPTKFKYDRNNYEYMKTLDEANEVPPFENFNHFIYLDMSLNAKYGEVIVRNFDLPLLTIDTIFARYMMILSYFSSTVYFLLMFS